MGLLAVAVPFIALLWVPSYNAIEPRWHGIPFFYWYQFLWILMSSALTAFAISSPSRIEGDPMPINWVALIVFIAFFGFVTFLGFAAVHWRRGDLDLLHEWGLAGGRLGTLVTWFLLGGDIYTAYTFIAVPALAFGSGALAFFAAPYTIIVPLQLGGDAKIFGAVPLEKLILPPPPPGSLGAYSTYATLALGSALALFLYPHSITGVLSSSSRHVIRRNAALLPAYTFLLGLIALLTGTWMAATVNFAAAYPLHIGGLTAPRLYRGVVADPEPRRHRRADAGPQRHGRRQAARRDHRRRLRLSAQNLLSLSAAAM